jgi:hypothetical protein
VKHSLGQRSREVDIVLIQVVPVLVNRPLIDRVPGQVLGSWGPHFPQHPVDSLQFGRGVTGHPVLAGFREGQSEHLSSERRTEMRCEWRGGFDQPLLVVDLCAQGRVSYLLLQANGVTNYCYSTAWLMLLPLKWVRSTIIEQ